MRSENATNDSADDVQLDRLLLDWSKQTTDTDRLNDLGARIIASLTTANTGHSVEVARPAAGPQPRRSVWMSGIVVASAAALLVSMTCFSLRNSDRVATHRQMPPESVWLRADQLQNKAALLAAMEETFDGHLHWLAETGDDVTLGLADAESSFDIGADDDIRMAVRIVVEQRSPGTSTWQVAWAMDVLTREEEVVRWHDAASELTLWTYQLPDGHIAVDSELTLTGANRLDAASSGLQHDRQPVLIFDEHIVNEHRSDVQYRVFQTVAVVDREVT